MIVKLLADQIPDFWDAIKFSVVQADEIDEKDMPYYLNELLHALLSDKAQCFVRIDEKRVLQALLITRVLVDKIKGGKYLYLQSMYSWKFQNIDVWMQDFPYLKAFAEKEQCQYLSTNSCNSAVWKLIEQIGFKERTRVFNIKI